MAIIALSAKLAKADGQVTRDEVAAFKHVFQVRPEDSAQVGHLYNIAREDTAGFEHYARQIGKTYQDDPDMLRDVMTGLLLIAKADGVIDKSEHDFLMTCAAEMGIPIPEFQSLASMHGDEYSFDPYAILGLPFDADEAAIRAAYREQIKRYHPDVWALTHGDEPDCAQVAEERTALINRAYEELKG